MNVKRCSRTLNEQWAGAVNVSFMGTPQTIRLDSQNSKNMLRFSIMSLLLSMDKTCDDNNF